MSDFMSAEQVETKMMENLGVSSMEDIYEKLGAKVIHRGGESVYNFGISGDFEDVFDSPDSFEPLGAEWDTGQKEFVPWKIDYTGFMTAAEWSQFWLTLYQEVGSCVMQGAINFVRQRIVAESILMKQPEGILFPNLLVTYAKSREFLGLNDRGDGSSGDTMAKALLEVGFSNHENSVFPKPSFDPRRGIMYGRNVELDFSQGRRMTAEMLELCRPHKGRMVKIRNVDQGRLLLLNGYGQTTASDWGGSMGLSPTGNPPVLLNRRRGVWHHQQSYLAVKHHPQFGWLYWREQSWGPDAHGYCPFFDRKGGFAVLEEDYRYDVTRGQVWTASGITGFVPQQFSHKV